MASTAGTAAKGGGRSPPPDSGAHKLSNGPSDDDLRAYVHDLREVDDKIAVLAKARKKVRAAASEIGIPLQRVDQRLKKQLWSPEDVREEWAWDLRIAELLGQPIGTQLELYGSAETPDAVRAAVRWRQIGRSHGLAGKGGAEQPPDNCPNECHPNYGEGWNEGQKETQDAYLRAADARGRA